MHPDVYAIIGRVGWCADIDYCDRSVIPSFYDVLCDVQPPPTTSISKKSSCVLYGTSGAWIIFSFTN